MKIEDIDQKDLDLFTTNEDAPQIVGVLDDRPPELRAKDFLNNAKWKVVNTDDGFNSSLTVTQVKDKFDNDSSEEYLSPAQKSIKSSKFLGRENATSEDLSPKRHQKSEDLSPRRFKDYSSKQNKDSDDLSPKRRKHSSEHSSRKFNNTPDISPPRRRNQSPDISPPRRRRNQSPDISPPRKRNQSPDYSPPRRRNYSPKTSPRRRNRSPDISPRRRKRSPENRNRIRSPDISPPRKLKPTSNSISRRNNRSSDISTRRRTPDNSSTRDNRSRDMSPNRRQESSNKLSNDHATSRSRNFSPSKNDDSPRRYRQSPDPAKNKGNTSRAGNSVRKSRSKEYSPRRKQESSRRNESDHGRSTTPPSKMKTTLDGKAAGLQNAKLLRIENDNFKKREDELFRKMDAELSGRNASVVMRDKKTGRIRDREAEARQEEAKTEEENKRKAIYTRWGKGVKQVEELETRILDSQKEMNKPLARYSDDSDLDTLLRNRERIGDPMLMYIKSKEQEKKKQAGIPERPVYRGWFPDNRFNIRPGYRWDGVDRSNGYEKKYFEMISKKQAGAEEAYRYSTEDM